MRRPAQSKEESGAPAWMATFADMATLLLTFFVLLLTFAEMDIVKFKDALGSIQNAMGGSSIVFSGTADSTMAVSPALESVAPDIGKSLGRDSGNVEDPMREIADLIEKMVSKQDLGEDVTVTSTSRGVIVGVKGTLFFNAGTADLKEEAKPFLKDMGEIMSAFPYEMSIEGHTDNVAISSARYPSNWVLSSARAYSALEYLNGNEDIPLEKVHIAGFADTKPICPNDTPEQRARNRRVQFVFYRPNEKFDDQDPLNGAENVPNPNEQSPEPAPNQSGVDD